MTPRGRWRPDRHRRCGVAARLRRSADAERRGDAAYGAGQWAEALARVPRRAGSRRPTRGCGPRPARPRCTPASSAGGGGVPPLAGEDPPARGGGRGAGVGGPGGRAGGASRALWSRRCVGLRRSRRTGSGRYALRLAQRQGADTDELVPASRRDRRRRTPATIDSLLALLRARCGKTAGCGQALLQFRAVLRRSRRTARSGRGPRRRGRLRPGAGRARGLGRPLADAALWYAEAARIDSTSETGRRALLAYGDARVGRATPSRRRWRSRPSRSDRARFRCRRRAVGCTGSARTSGGPGAREPRPRPSDDRRRLPVCSCSLRPAGGAGRRRHLRRRRSRVGERHAAQSTPSGTGPSTPFAAVNGRDASKQLDRVLLEFQPGDPRIAQAHFYLGEAHYAEGSHLEAAREFRKVPTNPQRSPRAGRAAPGRRCLRRPVAPAGAGSLLRPDRARHLPGAVNRYPGHRAANRAQERINELQERFAYKEYRAALYYFRLKAYDSAILYLKDLVATYPARRDRARRAGEAGAGVPETGVQGGRAGDLRIHPAFPPRGGQERRSMPGRFDRRQLGR